MSLICWGRSYLRCPTNFVHLQTSYHLSRRTRRQHSLGVLPGQMIARTMTRCERSRASVSWRIRQGVPCDVGDPPCRAIAPAIVTDARGVAALWDAVVSSGVYPSQRNNHSIFGVKSLLSLEVVRASPHQRIAGVLAYRPPWGEKISTESRICRPNGTNCSWSGPQNMEKKVICRVISGDGI